MNKKLQNGIIFAIFLLIVFLSTLLQAFRSDILYPSMVQENSSFDGLIFDNPVNVSDFSVVRSIEKSGDSNLFKYDVSFHYSGDRSDVRILNTPVRQIYLPEGVEPSRSNATLKGEYEKVNQSILESMNLKNIYGLDSDFAFLAKSEMRISLNEDVGEYQMTVYTAPREITYTGHKKLADAGVFITNARTERFTDNLGIRDKGIKPFTNTKTQSGIYVNSLEIVNQNTVNTANLLDKVSAAFFVIGFVLVVATIFLGKKNLFPVTLVGMYLTLLSMPGLLSKGGSNLGILVIFPVLSFLAYLGAKLIHKPKLKLEAKDFKQALGATILFFFLCILLFIVPRGL